MKKIALSIILLIVLLGTSIAYAMETTTFTGTTTGTNTPSLFHFTTYRTGNITVHATFPLNNHGIYQLNVVELLHNDPLYNFRWVCRQTLDARWGRASAGDMICSALAQPAGDYEIQFLSNRKVTFVLDVTAETNP